MASGMFNQAKGHDGIDWLTDTIRCLLVKSTYTFDPDVDTVNLVTNELTDASYTANGNSGRITIGNKTVTIDDTANEAQHGGDDGTNTDQVVYSSLNNETIGGMVFFKFVTNDTASTPICYCEVAGGQVTNGGDVTFNEPATGWYKGT